ncbi:MAG: cyclic nucleotide-binding domain-containing protein [Treponema sp.]|jgi:anti-sigma regulatory factor (Ser/Thr protein kinase)|nr:cyclic nucleotide-binding domain-containing protein [Treponema sp.]
MSIIGVINSNSGVRERVERAFKNDSRQDYTPRFLSDKTEIIEFLSYDLPEIVLINFSDPSLTLEDIFGSIKNDTWLMNFGVIGLFDPARDKEEDLHKKYTIINVLMMLDINRIDSHLLKNVQIIERNYQILFQREFSRNLMDGVSGSFVIENDILAVPLYAGMGATILAQRGLINLDNKMHLQLALGELIINAIEHGNCGITYEEKTGGMENGLSVVDLVAAKCRDPAVRAKKVEFQWEIRSDKSIFIIKDEGKGFDVDAYLKKVGKQDMLSLHGRGIKLATMLFHELRYNKRGNQVALIVKHDPVPEQDIPLGFSKEQVLTVKKGDIVLKEGDPSDFLYYISSGQYTVFHNRKQVGTLSAQDIFMGEMSFLLNQRRSAAVRAETEGKLILLTRKAFVQAIRKYPHYGIFLGKLLAKRLARGNDRNAALLAKLRDGAAT